MCTAGQHQQLNSALQLLLPVLLAEGQEGELSIQVLFPFLKVL